ncbi:hypothetical protein GCM10027188_29810 [Lysobacter humi (ex Lee et al. 2017)]
MVTQLAEDDPHVEQHLVTSAEEMVARSASTRFITAAQTLQALERGNAAGALALNCSAVAATIERVRPELEGTASARAFLERTKQESAARLARLRQAGSCGE